VFAIVGYGQVILICLLSPLFMAGTIASEQSGRTYDILLTTPLSNLQIVLGSLLGRLFFVLALLLSGLPLFAVLLIFGGVPISAVFVCFATSALLGGSVAVTLSVMHAGGRKAVFVFVIVIVISIAAYLVAVYLAAQLVRSERGPATIRQ
jgi:ABC-type transport system involved in multi-copper enzyme maturation permease subunit